MGSMFLTFPFMNYRIFQKFWNEKRQKQSDLDSDFDTEFNKILKVISIEANTGLDATKKNIFDEVSYG